MATHTGHLGSSGSKSQEEANKNSVSDCTGTPNLLSGMKFELRYECWSGKPYK